MAQNRAIYWHNLQMAYAMGAYGLPFTPAATPVSQATQQDPYQNDFYEHPSASGSGGTGGLPVPVINSPPLTKAVTQCGVPQQDAMTQTGLYPKKGGLPTNKVRLKFKQPKNRGDKDDTSSKKGDKDDKDGKDDDKPDDKDDKDGDRRDDK